MSEHENEERLFRHGLEQVAEGADVSAPVAANARTAARRRRTGRVVMAAAAASIAAVAVTSVVLDRDGSGGGDGSADPPVVDQPSDPVAVTEWRTEYWHDLQVDVPADWGWGTVPTASAGERYLCGGPGAMVRADGSREVNPVDTVPYVGRPIMLSDLCLGGDVLEDPKAPYVWLDADVEQGVFDVGGGYTQETVDVNGSRVTVATQDAGLRREILASATGGETCMSRLDEAPRVESMLTEGIGEVRSAEVCAYGRSDSGSYDLLYATTLDRAQATAYHAAVYSGQRENDERFCPERDELVLIRVSGDDFYGSGQVSQDTVANVPCGQVQGSPGVVVPLSEEGVEPWSRNGLQAVLRSFIGMLG